MDSATVINWLTPVSLMAIMLAMGLKVSIAEVWTSAQRGWQVVFGLLCNFVLVPLITAGLLLVFRAEAMVSIGFFTLAVSPGAPVGPPFTSLARGDVPFSIALMILLAIISAILSPTLLGLLIPWIAPTGALRIDYLAIVRTLMVAQLLPLCVGLAIRRWSWQLGKKIVKPVGLLANTLLVVLICWILAAQFEMLAAIRFGAWAGMTLLLLASLVVGWVSGGPNTATRKAMAVTTASRNVAVGLVIANRNFAETPAAIAVVAFGVYSIVGTLVAALVMRRLSGRISG
jgi:bile acid:Na+ symporter, BASS family